MTQAADFLYRVELTGARRLTERGWDVLTDAIDAADLTRVIHDAVVDALHAALPHEPEDDRAREEWYDLAVTALPLGAAPATL
jgi:hypothetical protein